MRLEHGRIYQQMGDILRKLGPPTEIEGCLFEGNRNLGPAGEPLVVRSRPQTDPRSYPDLTGGSLGPQWWRQRPGGVPLRQGVEAQQAQANTPTASTEDRLRLGQTLKSQGELLRLDGKWTEAASAFDRSITELERALAMDVKHPEIRNALALAIEARAWLHREVGELSLAEKNYRRALDLLERLVTEFPTVPRHREWLAKVCNSLGILAHETSRLDDAEAHLRREIPLVEQLAQDFPYQPEFRRELARALNVLGDELRLRETSPRPT